MMTSVSSFSDFVGAQLNDPEFAAAYFRGKLRLMVLDQLIDKLEETRESADLSKAELARAADLQESLFRKLTTNPSNPTFKTLTDVAAALGLKLALVPMSETEREIAQRIHASQRREIPKNDSTRRTTEKRTGTKRRTNSKKSKHHKPALA